MSCVFCVYVFFFVVVRETCSKTVLIFVIAFGYAAGTLINDEICMSLYTTTYVKHFVDILS